MSDVERSLVKARERAKQQDRANGPGTAEHGIVNGHSDNQLDLKTFETIELNSALLRNNRIVIDDQAPAASAYKMLRTRVLQRMRRNGWKTIAVTGTSPGEGKTLTAINLALNVARDANTTAILVDLDLRKPAVARYLGVSPKNGIDAYFSGMPAEHLLYNPGVDDLGLLLNEKPFANSSELISSPRMQALVHQLKAGDDRIVIFDMPPLLATDDMLAFSPFVDAVLLVLSQGKTMQDDLLAAKELLQETDVVGTVLNRSSEDVAPYYYYYGN